RIDPIAGLDSGERRPQRLRDLPDGNAECAGEAAIQLDIELRLLSFRRQTNVDGALHLLDLVGDRLRRGRELLRSSAPQLDLDLLLRALEIVREHRHRGATDVTNLLTKEATEIFRADAAIRLRHQSNVDVADIH